jgi:hypothetical protein
MLEKRREDRPGGWREIVDRLVGVLRATGSTARLPESIDHPLPPAPMAPTGRTALVAQTPTTLPEVRTRGTELRLLASVTAGALVLVLAAAWYSRRTREAADPMPVRTRVAAVRPTAVPPAGTPATVPRTGRLRILALPYARILSVVDGAGRPVALPKDATTPALLRDLPPGTYRVVLAKPDGTHRVERRVEVAAGSAELLSEPFETPSSLAQLLRTGGSRP